MAKNEQRCSFCGRSEREVAMLMTGLNGNICNECAETLKNLLS